MKSVELTPEALKIAGKPAKLPKELGFGEVFAPLMLMMKYEDCKWGKPIIEPYGPLSIYPACAVLHYSQQIFEGLKAHALDDGKVAIFRPDQYAKRFNESADRMGIPGIETDLLVHLILEYAKSVKDWAPKQHGASLYIRPLLYGTDNFLGLRKSMTYQFIIMSSPVGSYFKSGLQPIRVWVEREYVRAVRGGTGSAKTGGNYAGALKASVIAKDRGYDQVIWLDAVEKKWVEELGGMNVFFVVNDRLITSPLTGSILPGVTRASILEIAKNMGVRAEERLFAIDELLEAITKGDCTEGFACGTAAVITPIGFIVDAGKEYRIRNGKSGEITRDLYNALTDIQYGKIEPPKGWLALI
jgi:branched-chain amino acid aminotransferase